MTLSKDALQHSLKTVRKQSLSIAMILLISSTIFPFGWLAEEWSGFGMITDYVFGTELAHVIGHLGLFILVGLTILFVFPTLLTKPIVYVGLITFLGTSQEIAQLVSFKHRAATSNELFDVGIDLIAAVVAFKIAKQRRFLRKYSNGIEISGRVGEKR